MFPKTETKVNTIIVNVTADNTLNNIISGKLTVYTPRIYLSPRQTISPCKAPNITKNIILPKCFCLTDIFSLPSKSLDLVDNNDVNNNAPTHKAKTVYIGAIALP